MVSKFAEVDLHPRKVANDHMGLIFENLIRRFNELANETAGDHFTPREVIQAHGQSPVHHDDQLLSQPGTVRTISTPPAAPAACWPKRRTTCASTTRRRKLYVYGQDYNKRAYATAASDMLMKEVDHNGGGDNVAIRRQLHRRPVRRPRRFDYLLANPPFGVDWKKQQKEIQREHEKLGFDGRFGARLPRVNDGSLLFLQHMIAQVRARTTRRQQKHGSRAAIVFTGSPLFTGGAAAAKAKSARWIIENDWLEAIVALPEQMFYNTGIGTYIWIVTNRKAKHRKGKIQLLDARERLDADAPQPGRQAPLRSTRRRRIDDRSRSRTSALWSDQRDQSQDLRQRRLRLHAASPSSGRCACATR